MVEFGAHRPWLRFGPFFIWKDIDKTIRVQFALISTLCICVHGSHWVSPCLSLALSNQISRVSLLKFLAFPGLFYKARDVICILSQWKNIGFPSCWVRLRLLNLIFTEKTRTEITNQSERRFVMCGKDEAPTFLWCWSLSALFLWLIMLPDCTIRKPEMPTQKQTRKPAKHSKLTKWDITCIDYWCISSEVRHLVNRGDGKAEQSGLRGTTKDISGKWLIPVWTKHHKISDQLKIVRWGSSC